MKTIQKLKAILKVSLFILMIFSIFSFTERGINSSACVEISGKVVHKISVDKSTSKVYLFHRNTKVDSLQINGNRPFRFKLIRNDYYTIKIIKAGYVDRLISISTALPDGVEASPIFRFHFDIVPMEETAINKLNRDLLDFPIALVYYDVQKSKFVYSKKYTNSIKREITKQKVFLRK